MSTATSSTLRPLQTPGNTNIRALAAFVGDNMAAFGMVRTADTGQTDSGSLTSTSGSNTVIGYQIYRFNDTLQSTTPVFIRVEYGSGASNSIPAIWITVGFSTDGAGNITGTNKSVRTQLMSGTFLDAAVPGSFCSGDSSRFCVNLFGNTGAAGTYSFGFAIERSKASDGTDNADGVIINGWVGATNTVTGNIFLPASGNIRAAISAFGVAMVSPGSMADGSDIGFVPVFPQGKKGLENPGTNMLFYTIADTAALNPIPVLLRGTNHTYLPLGTAFVSTHVGSGYSFAIRYE
jgi:hypothetical protein